MAVLALQQNDRLPLIRPESPVDALNFGLDLGLQIVVALDVRAAWRSDLNEGKHSLIARILLQESLDRQKPLQNPFGVIEAVDAQPHHCGFNSQTLE